MGMLADYRARWREANADAIVWAVLAADRLGSHVRPVEDPAPGAAVAHAGLGAALALEGQISAGAIVAGTIIFGRALAPVEQVIAHWRTFIKAREAYAGLDDLLAAEPPASRAHGPADAARPPRRSRPCAWQRPQTRQLDARQHFLRRQARPDARRDRAKRIGQVDACARPRRPVAAAGGTDRPRWRTARPVGRRRRSAATSATCRRTSSCSLAPCATTSPASAPTLDDADVIAAAKAAHAHELILALPNGYDTELGAFGTYLSAGQRQRMALARALFAHPALRHPRRAQRQPRPRRRRGA